MKHGQAFFIGNYEYRYDILQCIEDRLNDSIRAHCKVLVVRIDVRFPQGYPYQGKSSDISEMMRRLMENYKNNGIRGHYVWVREKNTSDVPHYHVIFFLDGSRIENGWGVRERAQHLWERVLGVSCPGAIELCETYGGLNGLMIRRPAYQSDGLKLQEEQARFEATYNAVHEWARYLAKTKTKGEAPAGEREYQGSQL